MEDEKFSKSLKLFLAFIFLNFIAVNMGAVFMNIFLMRISVDSNSALIYNLVSAIVILASFFALAPISKKYSKKIGLVLGNVFTICLYIIVIILGESAEDYAWILGMFSGIGQGFMWLSINVLAVDLTNYKNRRRYSSVNGMIGSSTQLIAPILASYIVSLGSEVLIGYRYLFGFILTIMTISLILTLNIEVEKVSGVFSVSKAMKSIDTKKLRSVFSIVGQIAFREGVIAFLIGILVFDITKSEAFVSKVLVMATVISIVIYGLIPKIKLDINKMYIIGTSISIITVIILSTMFTGVVSIISYTILYGIAVPLFYASSGVYSQNVTEQVDSEGEYRFEIICIREFFIGLWRISGIILMLIFYNIRMDFSFVWVFGVFSIIISLWSIQRMKKVKNIIKQ